jgi:hypothetical protein
MLIPVAGEAEAAGDTMKQALGGPIIRDFNEATPKAASLGVQDQYPAGMGIRRILPIATPRHF